MNMPSEQSQPTTDPQYEEEIRYLRERTTALQWGLVRTLSLINDMSGSFEMSDDLKQKIRKLSTEVKNLENS